MTTDRRRAAAQRPAPPQPYYGFDPAGMYTLRSRVRAYSGTTERFIFANGQAIAYPMRPDATDEQKWARCERLGRLQSNPTYRLYVYGQEPPPTQEPMWRGQEDPTAVGAGEDTGEDTHIWQAAPEPTRPPVQMPVEGPTPSGRTSNELLAALPRGERNTGEMVPEPPRGPAAPPAPEQWDRTPETP